jgi:hypothetical protein
MLLISSRINLVHPSGSWPNLKEMLFILGNMNWCLALSMFMALNEIVQAKTKIICHLMPKAKKFGQKTSL